MIRILKSKKGMTITEVIMALAILGIVSIPLIAIFSNSIFITQLTKRQIEINAVMQIAKVEVIQAVKNPSPIYDYDDDTNQIFLNPPVALPFYTTVGNETTFLALVGSNLQNTYKYKVKYLAKGSDPLEPNIVKLIIKLYASDGKFLSELSTDIFY